MLFSEVYSAYFNTVAAVLREAIMYVAADKHIITDKHTKTEKHSLTDKRITELINQKAFSESVLAIMPALKNEEWLLLNSKNQTPIQKLPHMPMTFLQKRWLKTLISDPRLALFAPDLSGLDSVEPLFSIDSFTYFDQYTDGDPFTDASYIVIFRTILDAIKSHHKLKITLTNFRGREVSGIYIPHRLEYSQKDDKFRLISTMGSKHSIVNLARITSCEFLDARKEKSAYVYKEKSAYVYKEASEVEAKEACITFELTDHRNALERVMLHFSDCRKETRRLDDNLYRVSLWYDPQDETEILIRILSFGQMIKVLEPDSFVAQIRDRILRQQGLMPR